MPPKKKRKVEYVLQPSLDSDVETEDAEDHSSAKQAAVEEVHDVGPGLANVMEKILHKQITGKTSVISAKAKTEKELVKKKHEKAKHIDQPEIVNDKDESVSQPVSEDESVSSDDEKTPAHQDRAKKKMEEMIGRVKFPKLHGKERDFTKFATKGVVQLFNAVKQQQQTLADKLDEAGPSVRKRDQILSSVSKKQFLDLLHGKKSSSSNIPSEKPGSKSPGWNVLKDTFLKETSVSNWDQHSDSD